MATIGLALPEHLDTAIAAEARRYGHDVVTLAGSASRLVEAIMDGRPDAVVVGAGARYLTIELLAACDDAGVRLVVLAADEDERRRAAVIGLRDSLPADVAWAEIEPRIVGVPPAPPPTPRRSGTVVAVWGPAGAPGRTAIAIGIAAELAALGKAVVLADLDTYAASVAPVLGLLDEAPGFAAACRLSATGSLNAHELDRLADRRAAPGRPSGC